MEVTAKDLIEIVEKSSTISERLQGDFHLMTPDEDDTVNSKITSWCQTVANGNQKKFEKRLAWDGLDPDAIRKVLGSVRLADPQNLPTWTDLLKTALETSQPVPVENCFLDAENPLPFEELFLSFVCVARQKLKLQSGFSYEFLSPEAHITLEHDLLDRLTNLCSQALGIEFQIFRVDRKPSLLRWLGQIEGSQSKELYNQFIQQMLSGGLLSFFQEYTVLARIASTITEFWIHNISEFITRLTIDRLDIQKTFQNNTELGQVIAVRLGLSDLHQNGRSVIAIEFDSGLKLIYKPKDLALEKAFFQLLNWLNHKKVPQQFKLLQFLDRLNYGWVEYVEHLPCLDPQEAARYYQRSGMLLCLLYTLSGADFHHENIIACGEYPVPIDLEMLMSVRDKHEENPTENIDATSIAFEQFNYSVLSTSLLPKWELTRDGTVFDVSGLGGTAGQPTQLRRQVWSHINTDGMILGYENIKTKSCPNALILNGVQLSPSHYVEELVDGFRQMYQFLIAHRETLLAANSPLTKLNQQRVRVLFRPSQVYASLIQKTLQPELLRNGVERSIALDVLAKPLLNFEHKPRNWTIIAAEQQALTYLDIPLFTTRSDLDELQISLDQSIEQYLTEPGYELVVNRLRQLNENDLEQQVGFIRSSLYTRNASADERSLSLSERPKLSLVAIAPLASEVFVQKAIGIAQELQKRALSATDGSITWMGMEYIPDAGRFQPQPLSYDFYDGSSGVALFLAAIAKATNRKDFRDLALSALQPINRLQQNLHKQESIKKAEIGGGKGLGSIIYTLVRSSQFLEETTLLEQATHIASLISSSAIARDRKFDLTSGTSGTILGLLTLYNATQAPDVLDLALLCGKHLLQHRVVSASGYHTWATIDGNLLTGISHGAAGIAYALLRLYAVSHDPIFLQAAEEAIAYERSVFSPLAQNWSDFRGEKPGFGMSWCHGAPGIGLARLGSLAILNTTEICQDIEVALQTTQKFWLQDVDHLCCGNFGRIEVLLVAAQTLKQSSQLLEIARKYGAYTVHKAEKTGSFQLFPKQFRDLYNPGFFQGTAGIGYELLRLAYPEEFPSALLWQ